MNDAWGDVPYGPRGGFCASARQLRHSRDHRGRPLFRRVVAAQRHRVTRAAAAVGRAGPPQRHVRYVRHLRNVERVEPSGSSSASGRDEPTAVALPPSPPDRIRIPSLRVDAPLMGLGLTPTGSLDVPLTEKANLAGWYEAGDHPG